MQYEQQQVWAVGSGQWAVGGPETGGMSEHVGRRGGMHMHGVGDSKGGECA